MNYDAFQFAVDVLFKQELGDVSIVLNAVKSTARCSCGTEYDAEDLLEPCPSCSGFEREILSGEDIILTSIEVEDPGD